ncbi:MAG: FxDxF family PEP-CTERM protein [Zoogloeaceae bacterium]|jgi:hypothetical protein|nr:FxDxF family PEP-CTERM protein [Zoogloeaceae bacterium]
MRCLSKLVAATVLGFSFAGAAQAATSYLYGFDTDSSWGGPTTFHYYDNMPVITDNFLFSLTGDAIISVDLGTVGLSDWSVYLTETGTGKTLSLFDNPTGTFDAATLGAGSYSLWVSGNLAGSRGSYSIAIMSSSTRLPAVPEPETYAMLLAGLGIVGAVARRRSARA